MVKTVLFVDDELNARQYVSMAAEAYSVDFVVDTASSIPEAIQKLNTSHYDALILDVSLPGLNGSTFAPFVRKAFPKMPISFLSAYDSESAKEIGSELHAEYWDKTDKMTNFETMKVCIEYLIEGKSCDGSRSILAPSSSEGTGKIELPEAFNELLK